MAANLEGGAYLSSFVDSISKKLSSLLQHDSVLDSTRELLQRLDDCLCDVEPVLDDAELKQFRNERVKKWLVDLHDALYMVDDILDELSTKAATATPTDPGNSYDWSRYVDSLIEDSGAGVFEKLVGTLESIVGRKDKLRLKESAKLDTSWRIPSTSLVVSSDIFGRDNDKEHIIKLLLDDTCPAESPVTVISIVGLGGIGKTTLAQLVYNDAKIMGKFNTRAWVCVAENPDPINVTRTIIGAIDSSPCNLDHFDSLQTHLKKILTEKTLLVVLDDIWNDRREIWEDFLKPFQCGNSRSKILLTTRNEKVASMFSANNLQCRLSLLSNEDCWLVFLKHSSISSNSAQYATLESIGKKIVEKCKGLPLAVKTLGGLLRNKYDEGYWENILESEIWELSENESKIVPALRVSYYYLPSYLKRCFVYCSLFPEDYQFDKNELILLWMAEDLLQLKENNTLEDVGCAYFDELVARSFFQPSSDNETLFVMHDLMHDLATFFAGKFYFKLRKFGNPYVIDEKIRHLSCDTFCKDDIELFGEAYNGVVHMRTFLKFRAPSFDYSVHIGSVFWLLQQQLGCRVFSCSLHHLPNSIDESIHLRYLNLSNSSISTLSESICKLYNLQTLKLRNCNNLSRLPKRLQDLVNLRHLDIRGVCLNEMPEGMSKLKHLNFLSDYICWQINALKLERYPHRHRHVNDVQTERDILDKLQPHENLKELSIEGYRGETFPEWLGFSCYSNMTRLSLRFCVNCRELPSLGQLPSLQHLEISKLDGLEKIEFVFFNKNSGSFQQETPFKSLETLEFEDMRRWREWQFPQEFDGFPRLRILSIKDCPVLRGDLPAHLPALEELTIDGCEELACSLPIAPKLCQLCVKGGDTFHVKPQSVVISETQLAMSALGCLPHIQLPRVQHMLIGFCESAISISADCLPASLQYLQIFWCPELTFSEQLQHNLLTEIMIRGWGSVMLPLGDLPNLKKLYLSDCHSLVSLPAIQRAMPRLEELRIEDCPKLDCSAEEWLPPSLKILIINECHKLSSWIASKGLQSEGLSHLELSGCNDVKSFPREGCLPPSLESLQLRDFPNLETLDCKGLRHLTSLKSLTIKYCYNLENIIQEHFLASIEYIHIFACPLTDKLKEMEDLRIQFDGYYSNSDEDK